MTHDEIISNLFAEYDKVSKKRVVELFLSSLSTRKLLWRIGLPIIAIMRTFPNHLFCVANNSVPSNISPCQVCGDFQCLYETEEDTCEFLDGGGVLAHSIGDYYYGLKAINSLPSSSFRGSTTTRLGWAYQKNKNPKHSAAKTITKDY